MFHTVSSHGSCTQGSHPPPPIVSGEGVEPTLLRYSYYTAGSGGAGQTILETSFLLAGEECTVYK